MKTSRTLCLSQLFRNFSRGSAGKTILLLYIFLLVAPSVFSQLPNTWTQKADFGGTGRWGAVGFSIGSKGYLGTGRTTDGYKKDFWEYDPDANTWTQKTDFGGTARQGAIGFTIGNKGYLGTGYFYDGTNHYYKDFWEYDPVLNTWTQKADFGGNGRNDAVGFSIGSKGYLGTGYNTGTYYKDFWQYDPDANTWTQKADFGGTARPWAAGFSIGNKGYLGTGRDISLSYKKDFWEYDPDANTWTQKADFGGTARRFAVGFSIGSKGYLGTGIDGGYTKDFWEYDPDANTWTQKIDFGGAARGSADGFSIGDKGYIGAGYLLAGYDEEYFFKDFWEYTPEETAPACNIPINLLSNDITSSTVKLKWDVVSEAIGYKVRYKVAGTSEGNTIKSLDNIKTLHQLAPGTEYVWKAKSICGINPTVASDWSEKVFFTTAPLKLSSDSEQPSLDVYPNPFSNSATISFSLPKAIHATIELYDIAGRKLQTILDKKLTAGNHEVIFHRGQLIAGIYLLQVEMGDQVEVKKLVVE